MPKQTHKKPIEDKRVPADVPRKLERHNDTESTAKTTATKSKE